MEPVSLRQNRPALEARVVEIYNAVAQLTEDAQLSELRRKLLDLRREVHAP